MQLFILFAQSTRRTNIALQSLCTSQERVASGLHVKQTAERYSHQFLGKSRMYSYGQSEWGLAVSVALVWGSGNMLWRSDILPLSWSAYCWIFRLVSLKLVFTYNFQLPLKHVRNSGDGWEAKPTGPQHASRGLSYGHGSHLKCTSTNVLGCWWEADGTWLAPGVWVLVTDYSKT